MSDVSESLLNNFKGLCRQLNMDPETEDASWTKFTEVSKISLLEGNAIHWLCCALYSTSRGSHTPTVGAQNAVVIGNCISLTMLLRTCNMSIPQFFSKMRRWLDMANLPSTFSAQIDRMERIFGITFHLFKKYNEIFDVLFLCPKQEKVNNKFRSVAKCSYAKLYEFCWCLYLCAKNENPSYAEEIIHCLHLLICCVNFVYINVVYEKRTDLINPNFDGLPSEWASNELNESDIKSLCIIKSLCELTSAQVQDSLLMKTGLWNKILTEFFSTKTLHGNEETFLDILSNDNFERNSRSLKSSYEQFVLSAGEIDERILLNNPNYRKPMKFKDTPDGGKSYQQEMKSLNPQTPILRRDILPSKESFIEPVANATQNLTKLQTIAHITEPIGFLKKMDPHILEKTNTMLKQMSDKFNRAYPNPQEAVNRFQLSLSLFYYLMEKIIIIEYKTKPNIDINLFGGDTFTTTLLACCVEVVLNAYNSHLKFPWVLKECFHIPAFNFCKIIELVVRGHDNILTRSLIKHLNFIEECCFESLVWKKDSPLWDQIQAYPKPLPNWSDVDVNNRNRRLHPTHLQSPLNSAYETFNTGANNDSVRRDLFNTGGRDSCLDDVSSDSIRRTAINNRVGPLNIFLRKFYKLAWMRIEELCKELQLGRETILNVIWTLFEHAITNNTQLMKERHLDQIIMCAIYIYLKVSSRSDILFVDIMTSYRNQPQAKSEIYRNVLLATNPATGEPKFGDIIHFYNSIFVDSMSEFARQFNPQNQNIDQLRLSPHPTQNLTSATVLDQNTPLTVQQMDKKEILNSPHQLKFSIGKSPSKDLEAMNEIVRRGCKRLLPLDGPYRIDSKRCREL